MFGFYLWPFGLYEVEWRAGEVMWDGYCDPKGLGLMELVGCFDVDGYGFVAWVYIFFFIECDVLVMYFVVKCEICLEFC